MTTVERRNSIGTVLGTHLALFEEDLVNNPDDIETMEKIRIISEAYRNFATGGLEQFHVDFEQGYKLGKQDVEHDPTPTATFQSPPEMNFGDS